MIASRLRADGIVWLLILMEDAPVKAVCLFNWRRVAHAMRIGSNLCSRPQLVVSDGGDWTASVPTLEYPYLQRVHGFYDAKDKVTNIHLPKKDMTLVLISGMLSIHFC